MSKKSVKKYARLGRNKKTKKHVALFRKTRNKLEKKKKTLKIYSGGVLDSELISTIQSAAQKTTGAYLPSELAKKIATLKFEDSITKLIKEAQEKRDKEYRDYIKRLKIVEEENLRRRNEAQIRAGYDPNDIFAPLVPIRTLAEPRPPIWLQKY